MPLFLLLTNIIKAIKTPPESRNFESTLSSHAACSSVVSNDTLFQLLVTLKFFFTFTHLSHQSRDQQEIEPME